MVVKNWMQEIEVDNSPVKKLLSKSTSSKELRDIFANAAQRKIRKWPEAWEQSTLKMTITIGNQQHRISFKATQSFQLGDYPSDGEGMIKCTIYLSGKRPTNERFVVLHTGDEANDNVHATFTKPLARDQEQNTDTTMLDNNQPTLHNEQA